MVLIMAILDMLGIASIMPFIAVLSNPEIIEKNEVLSYIYNFFLFENKNDFIFALGLTIFFLLITSLSFKALTTYFQIRFTLMCEYSLGKRFLEGYLHQPYSWFLNKNSSDITKTILSEVSRVTNGCISPLMSLITQLMVSMTILTMLLIIDPICFNCCYFFWCNLWKLLFYY